MGAQARQAVRHSIELGNWLGDQLHDQSFESSDRNRMAAACLHIALTHHGAISLLAEHSFFASAFALLRPMVDSYVRGLWMAACATDEQLQGIQGGNDPPNTRRLAEQLEQAGHFDPGSLTKIQRQIWATVCDFNHTGARAISRHVNGTMIESKFNDGEIEEALGAADSWAVMAAMSVAGLATNDALAQTLLARGKQVARRLRSAG